MEVAGQSVSVYQARVRAEILPNDGLWTHRPDPGGERAAFAIFDMRRPVEVAIKPRHPAHSAMVLPARAKVAAELKDGAVRFMLKRAQHVTILFNGSAQHPLHLFVGEPEADAPRPDDPNVLYFGPGIHEITELKIKSGQTLYLAGGAVVRAGLRPGEKGNYSEKWKVSFHGGIIFNVAEVENVRICGRGILDAGLVPHPGRNMIGIRKCKRVRLSGITLRDAAGWNVHIAESEGVHVDDLRIISGRLNSDGINSTNSRDVSVHRCFVRNHDDGIVVKTIVPDPPCDNIEVDDCLIWSDWGYALGATYETRAPIHNLHFSRCDVLAARHWVLGVHISDSAAVSGLTFRDIEVADLMMEGKRIDMPDQPKLIRMVVQSDVWGNDPQRGNIRDILIENVAVDGAAIPPSEFFGADQQHGIEKVVLRNIHLRDHSPATDAQDLGIVTNPFVRGLVVESGSR